ncbi:MAG: hypothetical protein H6618_09355 [Deltaproteobacteria bacterium]|nr:hypothetical protein [Deltaproteobacteria bacterium]
MKKWVFICSVTLLSARSFAEEKSATDSKSSEKVSAQNQPASQKSKIAHTEKQTDSNLPSPNANAEMLKGLLEIAKMPDVELSEEEKKDPLKQELNSFRKYVKRYMREYILNRRERKKIDDEIDALVREETKRNSNAEETRKQ